jgi:hypothetical protein
MADRRWMRIGARGWLIVVVGACSAIGGDHPERPEVAPGPAHESNQESLHEFPEPAEWAGLLERIGERVDSTDRSLRGVRALSAAEQRSLRRDVNAVQVARARRMGIPRNSDPDRLLQSGRLVALEDTTEYWIVRRLDYSSPYVTPDTRAMLLEMGERFHAGLDSLGLPRFRFEVTSVLRTPAHQAALQRSNPNAARGVSAHEFGTTVDVAYRRFTPSADFQPPADVPLTEAAVARLRLAHDAMMTETATLRGAELQALLGRVIREMRDEGKLLVMMERRQTVYHMTVARSFPREPAGTAD